jgi:hypothetical protein
MIMLFTFTTAASICGVLMFTCIVVYELYNFVIRKYGPCTTNKCNSGDKQLRRVMCKMNADYIDMFLACETMILDLQYRVKKLEHGHESLRNPPHKYTDVLLKERLCSSIDIDTL